MMALEEGLLYSVVFQQSTFRIYSVED